VDFRLLEARLLSHLQARVRNGETSERGLARLTGVSQPHMHNVLKGTRLLSTDMADQILRRLRINLVDLLTAAEDGAAAGAAPADTCECRAVGLLDGWIGREYPYPKAISWERYPFPAAAVDRLEAPVAAQLAPDPLRPAIFSGSGVVLLDRCEAVRLNPDEAGYFAVDLSGGGMIGLVRRAKRQLFVRSRQADRWQSIALRDRGPLDVVQGRVSLVVQQL
jgi:hypothetical protein